MDVRRGWECPACGRRVKRQGDIVTYQCHCQEPRPWMRLVESQRDPRDYHPYIVPEMDADEWAGEEELPPAESTLLEEMANVVEIVEPPAVEELPTDEAFFSPEEEAGETPPAVEIVIPEVTEAGVSEPPAPSVEPSEPPKPENSTEQKPRKGKSRRRRSSRKRSRRGGSQNSGGEGG